MGRGCCRAIPSHTGKRRKAAAPHRKEKKKKLDIGKLFINISIGLCIFSLIWFFYALYMRSSLAKRVVTLHHSPRVLDDNSTSPAVSPERFWGSYRPQVYFGMKTRSPRSIVTGLMWLRQFTEADEVRDGDFTLTTEFVKRAGGDHGGDWTWRVTAKQHSSAPQPPVISLMFYKPSSGEAHSTKYASYNHLKTVTQGPGAAHDIVRNSLNRRFVFSLPSGEKRPYIAVDTYKPPPPRPPAEAGRHPEGEWTLWYTRGRAFSASQVKFSKAALSNMLGGMGYFHGQSVVQSAYNEYPLLYPEGALFTAVPSRSFFPRGFLWDEGFHQLLLSKWDPQVTREATGHWLDLINMEGWIPREQILGDEARSKVPAEFVVQRNENANPPTALPGPAGAGGAAGDRALRPRPPPCPFLRRLFPRLQTCLSGTTPPRRDPCPTLIAGAAGTRTTNLFLNPKTLTSGLDDYPRASHPSADERHVDLHCWMALASGIMGAGGAAPGRAP
ncbi:hypothetical protein SKAU_G00391410 [Synaphobranchus kaupii]|uniref:Mannosyl-oligosaccharide glucosidase n=1 Tax=Synaphobranchus kaupii TaxID=118154 RepID=A0A9Q1EBM3_SYNKA|nr:hypothetical protein SKAU_G00391410 [Synaphobranchus kaupii]